MCPVTGILVVGGSGGQLLIYDLKSTEERDSTEVRSVFSLTKVHYIIWAIRNTYILANKKVSRTLLTYMLGFSMSEIWVIMYFNFLFGRGTATRIGYRRI